MPSRDDRNPSHCSERMRICQKHLSKVYSRSKNLLVTARCGKFIPQVTGSAARGLAAEDSTVGKGAGIAGRRRGTTRGRGDPAGLTKFEKKKLSPYLSAIASLFDGPSLLKQFHLKKLKCGLDDQNSKTPWHSNCPQTCVSNTTQEPLNSTPFLAKGISPAEQSPPPPPWSSVVASGSSAGNGEAWGSSWKVIKGKRSEGDACIEPVASSNETSIVGISQLGSGLKQDGHGMKQSHSRNARGNNAREEGPLPTKRTDPHDGSRELEISMMGSGSNLISSGSHNICEPSPMEKWNLPSYFSNICPAQRISKNMSVQKCSLPMYQAQNLSVKPTVKRIYGGSTSNQHLLPSTSTAGELRERTFSTMQSTRNPSQPLVMTNSQQYSKAKLGAEAVQGEFFILNGRNRPQTPLLQERESQQRLACTVKTRLSPHNLLQGPNQLQPPFMQSTDSQLSREIAKVTPGIILPQLLEGSESQQKAIFTSNLDRYPPHMASIIDYSQQRSADMPSSRNPFFLQGIDARHKAVLSSDSKQAGPHLLPGPVLSQEKSISSCQGIEQLPYMLPRNESQQKLVSTLSSGKNPHSLHTGTDSKLKTVSILGAKNPLHSSVPGAEQKQKAFSRNNQRRISQMLPDPRAKHKSGSNDRPQIGAFASKLSRKTSNSANVLQASVSSFFGTSWGPSKATQTLTVMQLHDAICDHSSPDCPSFKKGSRSGTSPKIPNPALSSPRQSGDEAADLALSDHFLGAEGLTTNQQNVDDFPPHQGIMNANEKCRKVAYEVRTDMKRQEKSSLDLWRYGSMAVCIENSSRDYQTRETSMDPWKEILKGKTERPPGIHWADSGKKRVVHHVCQILRNHKWGKGAIRLLECVRGSPTRHCVNEILHLQKDPLMGLAFFNWVKQQKNYRPDVFAFTTMISVLGRARNLQGVRGLLEGMHTGGIEPTVATYNTLIFIYGKVDSLNESLRVFRIMQEAGSKPDNITYSILIHLCVKAGYLQEGFKLYQGMLESGILPDSITYSIVIDSLGKSGNLREARKLFREMKERGYSPNDFTYNSMIIRHVKVRKAEHALRYYNEMRGSGFKFNTVTCITVMRALGYLGKLEDAEGLFAEMQQEGLGADTAAYSLMVHMWGNKGNLDKAVSWYGRMLGSLVAPNLSVFSSLVKAHLEANLYESAQHFLNSMGMWGIHPDLKLYTILLHHCTVCEKQEHADAVLCLMDRLGHPAHRFLYELLTAKNQERHAIKSRVEPYFDSLEVNHQDDTQAFANALVDFLYKLQCKTDPGYVWELAVEKGLYPTSIMRQEPPNHWLVDLHSMPVGTALVALPKLLVMLRKNWVKYPTKRVYIVTGWGKRAQRTTPSAVKDAVNEVLDVTRSPFSLDHTNAGVFVSYGPPFCDWISQPLVMRKLGLLSAEGVVYN